MITEREPKSIALLVDSDPGSLQLLSQSLALCNMASKSFTNSHEALAFMQSTRPALIIADMNMPGTDGRTFHESLIMVDPERFIPAILLARWHEMVKKVSELREEIDAYLVKPFLSVELINTVKTVLRSAHRRQTAQEVDPLTRTYNRVFLERRAPRLMKAASEGDQPVACAMIDIDHLKKLNELYGTESGDMVLRAVAKIIKKNIRNEDVVIRYGGEEFLLFLPNQKPDAAFVVIDRIRRIVASRIFTTMNHQQHFNVTLSSGLNQVSKGQSLDDVIREADRTMVFAKNRGCNRTYVGISDATISV
jgi:diguanylate cyclase (GGDEF)-like protein